MRGVRLTQRGWGFAAGAVLLLAAAPVLSVPALLNVSALLGVLVVVAVGYVLLGQARIRVERTFDPEVVEPGDATTAALHVTNLSAVPTVEATWKDTIPRGLSAEASGTLPALGGSRSGRARVRVSYPVQGLRRGRHLVGPLTIDVADPFGLATRRHRLGEPHELVVLPRRADLGRAAANPADHDGASRPAPQHVGIGEDDVIARPYLPGDALKRMHWKASAHRGELMVRQEEQEVNPRAGVVIDTDATSFGTVHESGDWSYSPEFEWSVSAAASAAAHLHRAGYAVVVRSAGGVIDRLLDVGDDRLEDVLVDYAVLEPGATRSAAHPVPAGERTVFVLLGRPDTERAAEWVETLSAATAVIAFVRAGTRQSAMDVLDAARWRVVEYQPHDDVADIWSEAEGRRRAAS